MIFGLTGPRLRHRTVADLRRNLAIRGFTEPVLKATSVAQAQIIRRAWTMEVVLRTHDGHELRLTRRNPLGAKRLEAVFRTVLGPELLIP
ncbi:hypothetical protein [Amycolatopsis suaedae]|nr:hypothetical protein [Amycolatopsis suaedae]